MSSLLLPHRHAVCSSGSTIPLHAFSVRTIAYAPASAMATFASPGCIATDGRPAAPVSSRPMSAAPPPPWFCEFSLCRDLLLSKLPRMTHVPRKIDWWRRLPCVKCFVCAMLPLHFLILTDKRYFILLRSWGDFHHAK